MLSENPPFITLDRSCNDAVVWLADRLRHAGLSLVRTFDLQVARHSQVACPCPLHGNDPCDCQMVVLLIYSTTSQPLVMIAHGYNGKTWFSIVDTPQQRADPHLESRLMKLVASLPYTTIKFADSTPAN